MFETEGLGRQRHLANCQAGKVLAPTRRLSLASIPIYFQNRST